MPRRSLLLLVCLAGPAVPCPAAGPPRLDQYGDPLPPGAVARMGTVRWRHPGGVGCVAFAPDGKALATAGRLGPVRLWDVASGRPLATLPGRTRAAFSPDGKRLATLSGHNGVAVWDVAARRKLHEWPGAPGVDWDEDLPLAFSPDGKLLAVAGDEDGALRLYDLAAGRELRRVPIGQRHVTDLGFTPDGRGVFTTNNGDQPVRLWDVGSGKELRRLGSATSGRLALSPDGRLFAAGGIGLALLDAATGRVLRRLRDDRVGYPDVPGAAFSPDGRLLADAGPRGDALRLWDVAIGRVVRSWGRRYNVSSLAFAPDGRTLAGGDRYEATVHLWDLATGRELTPDRAHAADIDALALAPDGRRLASTSRDGRTCLWDAATGRPLRTWGGPHAYRGVLAFSPDGKALLFNNGGDALHLWDADTGRPLRELPHGGACGWGAFTPDGRSVVACRFSLGDAVPEVLIDVWDAGTGRFRRETEVGQHAWVACVALSPDGRTMFIQPGLWDLKTARPLLPLSDATVQAAVFSADGRTLVTAGKRDRIRLWEVATGKDRASFRARPEGSYAVALSPDGRLLASADGPAGAVRLSDVTTGAELPALAGHEATVTHLLFSPDGTRLYSASDDTTILAWDVAGRLPPLAGAAPDARRLEALWADLAGADAGRAWRAVWALAAAPRQAVPFLREQLRPARRDPALERRARELLAGLDADDFAARARAAAGLAQLGEAARPVLRAALAGMPSAEARGHLERLLGKGLTPGERRAVRAVEALEHAGAPVARRLLEVWAEGDPEARLTQEARAALRRWKR